MKRYLLVTDASAAEVEAKTGLRGHNTPLGTLVEDRDPIVEAIAIGLWRDHASPRGCPECGAAMLHRSNCKIGMAVT